jgi:hypothetical protein
MNPIPGPTLYRPPERLRELSQVRDYIESIDFTPMMDRMADVKFGGLGWSRGKLEYVERQYRRWLFLRRKHEGYVLPPSGDIDEFWHHHILDTRSYVRDCQIIFGYYLHHFPYLGIRNENDWAELERAWEHTESFYEEEFGEEIYDYDE